MGTRQIFFCDNCEAQKVDTVNHWVAALVHADGLTSFCTFEQADTYTLPRLDFCGQKCAGDAFHRLLNTGSVVKEQA